MSEHLTREDLVVAATKAALGAQPDIPASMHEYSLIVEASLPVVAKAITDRVREWGGFGDPWVKPPIVRVESDRRGYTVTESMVRVADLVRLLDEIDTETGVQR